MNTKTIYRIIFTLVCMILVLIGTIYFLKHKNKTGIVIPNEPTQAELHNDLIRVTSPVVGATISSPVTIAGDARGIWFFEASFPVVLVDWDGKIIAQGLAHARSDWMTTDFVPFTATLTFDTKDISGNYSNKGTLILKKDNPSGLGAHDDALEIPVLLK